MPAFTHAPVTLAESGSTNDGLRIPFQTLPHALHLDHTWRTSTILPSVWMRRAKVDLPTFSRLLGEAEFAREFRRKRNGKHMVLRITGYAALTSGVLALWITGHAAAADLPVAVYVPPVLMVEEEEAFDWERFYAGIFVGYGLGSVDVTTDAPVSFFDRTLDISGPLAGITIGRNFLLGEDDYDTPEDDRNILVGIEGDLAWAGMGASATTPGIRGNFGPQYVAAGIDALGTLRGRAGILTGDERNILAYVTAGIAAGHAHAELQASDVLPVLRTEGWLLGYTLGAGLEMAVDEDITIKAEYLYTDLMGNLTIDGIGGIGGVNTANFDFNANHVVKVGLNFHF